MVRGWRSLWVSVKIKVDETKVFTVSHISPAARSAQSASLVSENNKLFGINMTFVEDHVFFTKTRINYVCKKGLCHSAKCLVIFCNFHLCFLLFRQLIKKYLYSSKILVRTPPAPVLRLGGVGWGLAANGCRVSPVSVRPSWVTSRWQPRQWQTDGVSLGQCMEGSSPQSSSWGMMDGVSLQWAVLGPMYGGISSPH